MSRHFGSFAATQEIYLSRGTEMDGRMVKAGISHAALANNHTMDQGRSGLTDTYQHLLSAGITPIGYGNTSSESCQPVVIKKGKIKVALFNSVTLPLENWV